MNSTLKDNLHLLGESNSGSFSIFSHDIYFRKGRFVTISNTLMKELMSSWLNGKL